MATHSPRNKVLFLASSGSVVPERDLMHAMRLYLKSTVGATGSVEILMLADARPELYSDDQPIFVTTQRLVRELGYDVKDSHSHRLFNVAVVGAAEMDSIMSTAQRRGSICIVAGGDTWRLAAAFNKLPGLRKLIRDQVCRGELMWVSFSAGSIFAGRTNQLATDPPGPVVRDGGEIVKDGLQLCPYAIRPHAQDPCGRRAGERFERLLDEGGGASNDDGSPVVVDGVKYIDDGQAGLVLGADWYDLPAQSVLLRSRLDLQDQARSLHVLQGPFAQGAIVRIHAPSWRRIRGKENLFWINLLTASKDVAFHWVTREDKVVCNSKVGGHWNNEHKHKPVRASTFSVDIEFRQTEWAVRFTSLDDGSDRSAQTTYTFQHPPRLAADPVDRIELSSNMVNPSMSEVHR